MNSIYNIILFVVVIAVMIGFGIVIGQATVDHSTTINDYKNGKYREIIIITGQDTTYKYKLLQEN